MVSLINLTCLRLSMLSILAVSSTVLFSTERALILFLGPRTHTFSVLSIANDALASAAQAVGLAGNQRTTENLLSYLMYTSVLVPNYLFEAPKPNFAPS